MWSIWRPAADEYESTNHEVRDGNNARGQTGTNNLKI